MVRPMRKIEIDPKAVEDCAARGLTQRETAEELGVLQSSFLHRISPSPSADLRGAWLRGRARRDRDQRAAEITAGATPGDPRALVIRSVYAGIKSRREIREETGLEYWRINDALDELKAEGLVQLVETLSVDYFRRAGSDEQPPKELGGGESEQVAITL
jgi:transcriptional regulator with XRE-family HTH domain